MSQRILQRSRLGCWKRNKCTHTKCRYTSVYLSHQPNAQRISLFLLKVHAYFLVMLRYSMGKKLGWEKQDLLNAWILIHWEYFQYIQTGIWGWNTSSFTLRRGSVWSGVCGGGVCGGGWCGGGCYAFCAKINVCLRGDTFIQKAHGHLSTVFPNYIRIAASFSIRTTIPKAPKKMQFVFQWRQYC